MLEVFLYRGYPFITQFFVLESLLKPLNLFSQIKGVIKSE